MKKIDFLFKPIFFIFSLLFAAWMLMKIEKLNPSDFDDHKTHVSQKSNKIPDSCLWNNRKKYLQNLCTSYKAGMIDSSRLDEKLTIFLESTGNKSANKIYYEPGYNNPALGIQ
jgi:hypothetical protein